MRKFTAVLIFMLIAAALFASVNSYSYSTDHLSDLYVDELYSGYTSYSACIPSGFIVVNAAEVSSVPVLINVDNIAMIVPVKHYESTVDNEFTWRAEIYLSFGVGIGNGRRETTSKYSAFTTYESYAEVIQMICNAQRN